MSQYRCNRRCAHLGDFASALCAGEAFLYLNPHVRAKKNTPTILLGGGGRSTEVLRGMHALGSVSLCAALCLPRAFAP